MSVRMRGTTKKRSIFCGYDGLKLLQIRVVGGSHRVDNFDGQGARIAPLEKLSMAIGKRKAAPAIVPHRREVHPHVPFGTKTKVPVIDALLMLVQKDKRLRRSRRSDVCRFLVN